MCQHATVRLASTLGSVPVARSFAAARLGAWGGTVDDIAQSQVADAMLVVSELSPTRSNSATTRSNCA